MAKQSPMGNISFNPRWREELVATSDEGKLVFEITMGELHVYFPGKKKWKEAVPGWAKDKREIYLDACERWCSQNNIPLSVANNTFFYEEKKQ